MMTDDLGRFPESPPSEVEWEELLVKYEIAPRALAVAVSDVEDGSRADSLASVIFYHVRLESMDERLLEAMRKGHGDLSGPLRTWNDDTLREMTDAFAELRGRNFATVQRRGIDVWSWSVNRGATRVTPYRLLLAAVARDGGLLAAVRQMAREARA